jgi:DNA-directed RNA polymerase subunit beta'
MLREIMRIYQLAGIALHEKHFTMILRQLLRFVCVDTAGDTALVPGICIDLLNLWTSIHRDWLKGENLQARMLYS